MGAWAELCGTGIAVGSAGSVQDHDSRVLRRCRAALIGVGSLGWGMLVSANGRENCRTWPGRRKTLQSLLRVGVCSSTAESRLREDFTSGGFFCFFRISIYLIIGIEVCCSCCFLLIPSMASLLAVFLQAAIFLFSHLTSSCFSCPVNPL